MHTQRSALLLNGVRRQDERQGELPATHLRYVIDIMISPWTEQRHAQSEDGTRARACDACGCRSIQTRAWHFRDICAMHLARVRVRSIACVAAPCPARCAGDSVSSRAFRNEAVCSRRASDDGDRPASRARARPDGARSYSVGLGEPRGVEWLLGAPCCLPRIRVDTCCRARLAAH